MDRRERKWRAKEYHENPVNSWANIYKGCVLAGFTLLPFYALTVYFLDKL